MASVHLDMALKELRNNVREEEEEEEGKKKGGEYVVGYRGNNKILKAKAAEKQKLLGRQFALEKKEWGSDEDERKKKRNNATRATHGDDIECSRDNQREVDSKLFKARHETASAKTIEDVVIERLFKLPATAATASASDDKQQVHSARIELTKEATAMHGDLVPEYKSQTARLHTPSAAEVKASKGRVVIPSTGGREARKIGTQWIEKQLQYTHRLAIIERERADAFGLLQQNTSRFVVSSSSSSNKNNSGGSSSSSSSSSSSDAVFRAQTEQLWKEMTALEDERAMDVKLLKQKLQRIRKYVHSVSKNVARMERGQDGDYIDSLQATIERAEHGIDEFRGHERDAFENLVSEEAALEREVSQFERTMQEWEHVNRHEVETITSVRHKRSVAKHVKDSMGTNVVEEDAELTACVRFIEQLSHQLESHAKDGSQQWIASEQDIFDKCMRSVGLTDEFILSDSKALEARVIKLINKCSATLASRSVVEIRAHFEWHVAGLHLNAQKKQKVADWRALKTKKRQDKLFQKQDASDEEARGGGRGGGVAKAAQYQQQQQEEEKNNNKETQLSTDELNRRREQHKEERQKKKKEAIQKWHAEKEARQNQQSEAQKRSRRSSQARDASRHQDRAELKQKISLYKLKREQEQAKKEQEERLTQKRDKPSKQLLENLSARAIEQAIEKRKLKNETERQRKAQAESRAQTVRPSSAAASKASRDPSRIVKQTQASSHREITPRVRKELDEERKGTSAHQTHVPGGASASQSRGKSFGHMPIQPRAVPSWRRNL